MKCRLFLVDPGEIFTWNPRTLKIHRDTNSNKFREFVTRPSRKSISKTYGLSCMRIYGSFKVVFSQGNLFTTVRRSKYLILRTRGPTLLFRICLSSMTTDGPSASNYIHRVKRALLMMTTHVDAFCHSFGHRILNNATPWISQDIQIIT